MHIAALNGHPDTAMVLFKKGVPLLMPNRNGARGIHTAAMKGHVAVINSLLAKGENVDAVTNVSPWDQTTTAFTKITMQPMFAGLFFDLAFAQG